MQIMSIGELKTTLIQVIIVILAVNVLEHVILGASGAEMGDAHHTGCNSYVLQHCSGSCMLPEYSLPNLFFGFLEQSCGSSFKIQLAEP
jgi:hypothetical protein